MKIFTTNQYNNVIDNLYMVYYYNHMTAKWDANKLKINKKKKFRVRYMSIMIKNKNLVMYIRTKLAILSLNYYENITQRFNSYVLFNYSLCPKIKQIIIYDTKKQTVNSLCCTAGG